MCVCVCVCVCVHCYSIADKAWYLLEAGMDQLRKCDHVIVQRGVARKLLSMGHTLPQWLVDKYKVYISHVNYANFCIFHQASS